MIGTVQSERIRLTVIKPLNRSKFPVRIARGKFLNAMVPEIIRTADQQPGPCKLFQSSGLVNAVSCHVD